MTLRRNRCAAEHQPGYWARSRHREYGRLRARRGRHRERTVGRRLRRANRARSLRSAIPPKKWMAARPAASASCARCAAARSRTSKPPQTLVRTRRRSGARDAAAHCAALDRLRSRVRHRHRVQSGRTSGARRGRALNDLRSTGRRGGGRRGARHLDEPRRRWSSTSAAAPPRLRPRPVRRYPAALAAGRRRRASTARSPSGSAPTASSIGPLTAEDLKIGSAMPVRPPGQAPILVSGIDLYPRRVRARERSTETLVGEAMRDTVDAIVRAVCSRARERRRRRSRPTSAKLASP